RDREPPYLIFEHDNQAIARRVDGVKPLVDPAAEGGEHSKLVEPPVSAWPKAFELGQHALAGRAGDEDCLRLEELLGQRREPEAERFLQANRTEEPERVVVEDRLRDGAQQPQLEILAAPAGIDVLTADDGKRNRVD